MKKLATRYSFRTLSPLERSALKFAVLTGTIGALFVVLAGMRQGWFEHRALFFADVSSAEGIREGTPVELAGVRIGRIRAVELKHDNSVRMTLSIRKQFLDRIREGTRLEVVRPYAIGDKSVIVIPGARAGGCLEAGSTIAVSEVASLTDLLSGRYTQPLTQAITSLSQALQDWESQPQSDRTRAAVVAGVDFFSNASQAAKEFKILLHGLNKSGTTDAVRNLAALSEEIKRLVPIVGPELPKTSRRLVEALDETVVVLKAMQKTFLLSSSAKEVRREEATSRTKEREISSSPSTPSPR